MKGALQITSEVIILLEIMSHTPGVGAFGGAYALSEATLQAVCHIIGRTFLI